MNEQFRCSKCNTPLIPTPESMYQEMKCPRCKKEYNYKYTGNSGHGIG